MPGTRRQTVFPNSVFAKRAATPTQKPRPTSLRAARSECAQSISAPRSAEIKIKIKMKIGTKLGMKTKIASSFRIPLNQHLPQTIDFLLPNTLIFQEVQDQLLLRVLKKTAHQMPNLRALRFLLPDQRRVHMCAPIL